MTATPHTSRVAFFFTSPLMGEVGRRPGGGGTFPPTLTLPHEGGGNKIVFRLLAGVIALSLIAASNSEGTPSPDTLARAEHAFAEGTNSRDDSASAKKWFAEAARQYDDLWRQGCRNPVLALNRARSHRLGGNLPGAIAALNAGLAVARYDRPLQVELEDARSAVVYPIDGELLAQCRPVPARTIGTRMSPAEAFAAAGGLWLLVCLGVARFAMTRAGWWLAFAGWWLVCLMVLSGLWYQDHRHRMRNEGKPPVVLKFDATLRKGNGNFWPPRLDANLPRGVEARELGRRGGWVQVELAGGTVGWVPETVVMGVE